MYKIESIIGRATKLFDADLELNRQEINEKLANASCLVVGGAGTIGQSVVKELFMRDPRRLDVVDISENNLVELVRDIRSSFGYGKGEFRTFALDAGSCEFDAFADAEGPYDYVLNLAALKHVRSERDPYTLMRMLAVNVLNSIKLYRLANTQYFAVSTDKSTRPANLMGASKRAMELALSAESENQGKPVSSARFANVAFSDGSLLHGFTQRILKRQPLSAPKDVKRYFISQQESGELCLLASMLGRDKEIFFPILKPETHLLTFSEIAVRFLDQLGYEAIICESEDEARGIAAAGSLNAQWPCYFFESDTTGEKPIEEFHSPDDEIDFSRFRDVGVILNALPDQGQLIARFLADLDVLRDRGTWTKQELVELIQRTVPELDHLEKNKYLDGRM